MPGWVALILQLPVLLRLTLTDETLPEMDWLPVEQDPEALKLTCTGTRAPPDVTVAVIVYGELEIETELGKEPRTMAWLFLTTAGVEGRLWREAPKLSGTRVVVMV